MTSTDPIVQFSPYGWPEPAAIHLIPTYFLDADADIVRDFALAATVGAADGREQAVRLYYAVRDGFRYDPYGIDLAPAAFTASSVLRAGRGYCIPKAVLLAAAARVVGIPSVVGLSDVVNHFNSPRLKEAMGGREEFLHHGWAGLHVDGRWVKAAPAFNVELCAMMNVPPMDFDGRSDALLQQYDAAGKQRMTYLRDHGAWSDLPHRRIVDELRGYYPPTLWRRSEKGADFAQDAASAIEPR